MAFGFRKVKIVRKRTCQTCKNTYSKGFIYECQGTGNYPSRICIFCIKEEIAKEV